MYDVDDLHRDLTIALVIVLIAVGAGVSIYLAVKHGGDYNRITAILASAVWVYIAFRCARRFKMWGLWNEIQQKEFFLQHMKQDDPKLRDYQKHRNEAETRLEQLRKD